MDGVGVIYVAYGENARRECGYSVRSLWEHNPGMAVAVIGAKELPGTRWIKLDLACDRNRWAKLNALELSPFDSTLYLDADTRVMGDVTPGFGILSDGWDMALAGSGAQGSEWLWHCDAGDREATMECLGFQGLQLGGGMWFVARNERTRALFAEWRAEWLRCPGQDQGALLRALYKAPVRVWMLGSDWNSAKGRIVNHRYGMARER